MNNVHCESCGQTITEKAALAKERKRLADKAKEQAREKALDKAIDSAVEQLRQGIKQVNAYNKFVKLELEEYSQGDTIAEPVEYVMFKFKIVGIRDCDELTLKEAFKVLRKLGAKV